jgi:transposase
MRVIGMDIHRAFAQVAVLEDGEIKQQLRVDLVHHRVVEFAKTLSLEDEVVVEATGNSAAVERLIRPYVKRVAIANPRLVRAIAYARVKTDKIDASILAKLHASGFLPEIWVADDDTLRRRRQIAERMRVLEQSVCTKGRIQAILHTNLIPKYNGHLFGKAGRKWLDGLPLPEEERAILVRLVHELERVTAQLADLDKVVAQQALADPRALRLMTIPGVSSVVSSTVLASIGDISRFPPPRSSAATSASRPRSVSPVTDRRGTAASPSRATPPPGRCWSRRPGRRRRPQDRCAPSSCASTRSAAPKPQRWRQPASWR